MVAVRGFPPMPPPDDLFASSFSDTERFSSLKWPPRPLGAEATDAVALFAQLLPPARSHADVVRLNCSAFTGISRMAAALEGTLAGTWSIGGSQFSLAFRRPPMVPLRFSCFFFLVRPK